MTHCICVKISAT